MRFPSTVSCVLLPFAFLIPCTTPLPGNPNLNRPDLPSYATGFRAFTSWSRILPPSVRIHRESLPPLLPDFFLKKRDGLPPCGPAFPSVFSLPRNAFFLFFFSVCFLLNFGLPVLSVFFPLKVECVILLRVCLPVRPRFSRCSVPGGSFFASLGGARHEAKYL